MPFLQLQFQSVKYQSDLERPPSPSFALPSQLPRGSEFIHRSMEKVKLIAGKPEEKSTTSCMKNLSVDPSPEVIPFTTPYRGSLTMSKRKPQKLVSLCLGVLGKYFEEIIEDLPEISSLFPSDIKMTLAVIARRKKLLNDDVLLALVDNSWDLLDISGSPITDLGLAKVARACTNIKAADISCCDKITVSGVSELMHHCCSLETLRCGGCPASESTARRSVSLFMPTLKVVEEESWEELDSMEIFSNVQSLRWLVWPRIDDNSRKCMATECPRVVVNPQPSLLCISRNQIPRAAFPNIVLDDLIVEDIDPQTWVITKISSRRIITPTCDTGTEMSMAEKFRLAFEERDTRLAPKRAKNARQHQRRAERVYWSSSVGAKSIALASQSKKYLHHHT